MRLFRSRSRRASLSGAVVRGSCRSHRRGATAPTSGWATRITQRIRSSRQPTETTTPSPGIAAPRRPWVLNDNPLAQRREQRQRHGQHWNYRFSKVNLQDAVTASNGLASHGRAAQMRSARHRRPCGLRLSMRPALRPSSQEMRLLGVEARTAPPSFRMPPIRSMDIDSRCSSYLPVPGKSSQRPQDYRFRDGREDVGVL